MSSGKCCPCCQPDLHVFSESLLLVEVGEVLVTLPTTIGMLTRLGELLIVTDMMLTIAS